MKKILLILMVTYLTNAVNGQEVTTLRIDPTYARGGSASQIFDKIDYIPLETNKESLFGKIDQLEVTPNYFIVLDNQTQSILIFLKDGSFHAKIKVTGNLKFVANFTVDRDNNHIIFDGDFKDKLFVYDFDGKLVEEAACPSQLTYLYCLQKDQFIYHINRPLKSEAKDTPHYDITYSNGFNKITKKLLPYNAMFVTWDYSMKNPFNYTGDGISCMFSLPYDYNVYQLSAKGIDHQYKFIFPVKFSLPNNFSTDSSFTGKRMKWVYNKENEGKFLSIDNIFKIKNNLVFTTNYEGMVTPDRFYNYNLKSGNLYSFGRVNSDSLSYYLPVIDPQSAEKLKATYDGYIYATVPSMMLLAAKKFSDKKITYNEVLSHFFEKNDRMSNPVIIQAKLKEDL